MKLSRRHMCGSSVSLRALQRPAKFWTGGLLAAAVAVSTLAIPSTANAAAYFFDVNGATAGSGVTNGGVYFFGSAVWNNNVSAGNVATTTFVSGNDPTFSAGTDAAGLSYTVKINDGVAYTIKNMKVEDGDVTLAPDTLGTGSLVQGTAGNWTVAPSTSLTVTANVTFTAKATLLNSGSTNGTINLAGNNTGAGGVLLNDAFVTLGIGSSTALGTGTFTWTAGVLSAYGGNRSISNVTALDFASGTFTGSNNLTINGSASNTSGANQAIVVDGPGSLNLASGYDTVTKILTKSGAGTLAIGGTYTTTKTTLVQQGALLINGTQTTGDAYTVTPTVAGSPATLGGSGSISLSVANKQVSIIGATISGTPTLAILNPGDGSATPGTLTITSSGTPNGLLFGGPLSQLTIDINGATADRVTVNGNLSLPASGDTLAINTVSLGTAAKYTILSYSGTKTDAGGTGFSSVTGLSGSGYRLSYSNFNATNGTIDLIHQGTVGFIAAPANAANVRPGTQTIGVRVSNTAPTLSDAADYSLTAAGVTTLNGATGSRAADAGAGFDTKSGTYTAVAGANTKTVSIANTGANAWSNTPSNVTITQNAYDVASPTLGTVAFGNVRVGATQTLSVQNTLTAPSASFQDSMDVSVSGTSTSNAHVTVNTPSAFNLVAGAAANTTSIIFTAAQAGSLTATKSITLNSNHNAISGLSDSNVSSNASITGNAYDYAKPTFSQTGGDGSLTANSVPASSPYPAYETSYTLAFGSFAAGSGTKTAVLNLANILIGSNAAFQDVLNGSYTMSGSGVFGGWSNFSDISAAASQGSLNVTFDTTSAGVYSGSLTFTPASKNGAGLGNTNMTDIVIALSGTATGSGSANFIFTDTTAVTLNVLKGASTSSVSAAKTIENNGTATGTASLTNNNSNLTITNGSLAGIAVSGTAGLTLTPTSTGTYGSTTNTVVVSPNNGSSHQINTTVNVGQAPAFISATMHDHLNVGAALSADVAASGSYAGLSSETTTDLINGVIGSEAIISSGTASAATTVEMAWRTRNPDEVFGSYTNPPVSGERYLLSDVVQISGTGSDTYTLMVSYDPGLLYMSESVALANGWIRLMWLNPNTNGLNNGLGINDDEWIQAGANFVGTQAPTGSDPLGTFGVDTTGPVHYAWAVVNHSGQFAVVPEPSSLGLLAIGAAGLLSRRRRR